MCIFINTTWSNQEQKVGIRLVSKSNNLIYISLVLVLVLSVASAAFFAPKINNTQDNYKEAIVTARTEMWQSINSGQIGSGAIAIMDNGKIVYSEGFGMADRENSTPVTSNTLFNIGSISKTFCATAIMVLVDDGKVKLDDNVTNYLPDFTMADPRYKDITVRMLLDHTSGLPGTTWSNSIGYEYNVNYYQEVLSSLSQAHLKAAPGEAAPYTNDAFTLAEMIVARVSGESYIDFLSQRVFQPLSLDYTGLSVGEQTSHTIAQYYSSSSGLKDQPQVVSILGAGGLASTPNDLVRFADSFSSGGQHILSQASLDEMMKAQPSAFAVRAMSQIGVNPEWQYGLGLDFAGLPVYHQIGIDVFGKGGDVEDYHGSLISSSNQRLSVAVLVSGLMNKGTDIAFHVFDAVLQEKGLMQKPDVPIATPSTEPIPAQYASFEGYYSPKYQFSFDFTANVCFMSSLGTTGTWSAPYPLAYRDGYFDAGTTHISFATVDGQNYMLMSVDCNTAYIVGGQQLKQLDNPLSLGVDINGAVWLRRNVAPYEAVTTLAPPYIVVSATTDGLPGYVGFNGIKVVDSLDHAGMPAGTVRDQTELTLLNRDGQVWVQASDAIYSPISDAKLLNKGTNSVTIGSEGYNEWFVATSGAVLSFQVPAKDKATVFAPDGSPFYDSATFTGEVYVPQGCFVMLAGQPGDVLGVSSK